MRAHQCIFVVSHAVGSVGMTLTLMHDADADVDADADADADDPWSRSHRATSYQHAPGSNATKSFGAIINALV